jgi:hypothetical protein
MFDELVESSVVRKKTNTGWAVILSTAVQVLVLPGRQVSISFGHCTRMRGTWHSSECVIAFRRHPGGSVSLLRFAFSNLAMLRCPVRILWWSLSPARLSST